MSRHVQICDELLEIGEDEIENREVFSPDSTVVPKARREREGLSDSEAARGAHTHLRARGPLNVKHSHVVESAEWSAKSSLNLCPRNRSRSRTSTLPDSHLP